MPNEPIGNADYPQWQCEVPQSFYGGFLGIPIHCMRPIMATSDYNLYIGKLSPWFGNSTGSSVRGNAFASGSVSNPSSISRIYDRERPYSINDFKDASWFEDDTYAKLPARRLTEDEIDTLKESIERNVDDDCKKYIALLINTVADNLGKTAVSTDIFELFDKVRSADGKNEDGINDSGFWGFLVPSTSTAHSYWKNNNGSVALSISNQIYGRPGAMGGNLTKEQFNNLSESEQQMRYEISAIYFLTSADNAIRTIHELIHNSIFESGGGQSGPTDEILAIAALGFEGKTLDLSSLSGKSRYLAASRIYDNRLRVACGFKPIDESQYAKYIK